MADGWHLAAGLAETPAACIPGSSKADRAPSSPGASPQTSTVRRVLTQATAVELREDQVAA
jgi:hypothetical protein